MQELGAVRRRQSAMETMPPPPSAVPQVSPEQVKLTAEDAASAMGEKVGPSFCQGEMSKAVQSATHRALKQLVAVCALWY